MDYVGTIKVNKRGVPKAGVFPKKGRTVKKKGTMKCMELKHESCSHFFTSWQDSKPVHILSSFKPYMDVCMRGKETDGKWAKEPVDRPSNIGVYNGGMGGTDKVDQLAAYYDDRHRSRKWQQRIFTHFLRVTIINAHVIWSDITKKRGGKPMVLLTFMKHLAEQLCVVPEEPSDEELEGDEDSPDDRIYNKKETWKRAWKRRNSGKHVPQTCSDANRRLCIICSQKTCNTYQQCDVHVHWDCWSRFHDLANPWMGHP
jgi:hypothetical protein